MPANLLPNETIPERAARVDSPEVLKLLRLLNARGFIMNGRGTDKDTVALLNRLAEEELVDPGYDGSCSSEPFIWVSNSNGNRVLSYLEAKPRYQLRIHPPARTIWESLPEEERAVVQETFDKLLVHEPDDWPREKAVHLESEIPQYLLNVSPDLWAFITVFGPGEFELFDIMKKDTLRQFLEQHRTGSKAG